MGGLCSKEQTPEALASKEVNYQMEVDRRIDEQKKKMLLLGAGESGKSTFFKQLKNLYPMSGEEKGFTDKEIELYVSNMHSNIITNIRSLLTACEEGIGGSKLHEKYHLHRDEVFELKEELLTEAQAKTILTLWKTEEIQKTYENRAKFQLVDNAAYFFERIEDIVKPDFKPSQDDIVRVRVRTTGIVEQIFSIDGNEFLVVDVGGQRSERKKWMKCFSSVTAVLFCAAISAFDQVLFEDAETNRMDEAVQLFKYVCEQKDFAKISLIVFLNKSDLFREKLKKVQLKSKYPEYDGDNSFESGCEFMKSLFEKVNEEAQATLGVTARGLYTHITCATDESQVRVLFFTVKDIVIREKLEETGLLSM